MPVGELLASVSDCSCGHFKHDAWFRRDGPVKNPGPDPVRTEDERFADVVEHHLPAIEEIKLSVAASVVAALRIRPFILHFDSANVSIQSKVDEIEQLVVV